MTPTPDKDSWALTWLCWHTHMPHFAHRHIHTHAHTHYTLVAMKKLLNSYASDKASLKVALTIKFHTPVNTVTSTLLLVA